MADTRTKTNTQAYGFHYVPDEGVLRGTIFEQQTEDAINDLGERTYEAGATATEALTTATTANKVANEALAIGNAAQTAADNAQSAADAAQADADNAQSTADTALALAQSNSTTITGNIQNINTLIQQVADNKATIEEIITVNNQQTIDLTALENRVSTNESNISVNTNNISSVKDYQDPDGVTDANDLQETANYELSGVSNLPSSGTYHVEVRLNQSGDSNEIIQTATDKATGTVYIRYGEIADSEDDGTAGATTWSEWLSPEKDLQDLTATHTKEIATLQTDLSTHEADTNNPHKVTAEQLGLASAYRYISSVESYSALPTSGLKNGDVYNVEIGDDSKGIPDGANVAWNGSGWDLIGGDLSDIMTDIDNLQTAVEAITAITADEINVIFA